MKEYTLYLMSGEIQIILAFRREQAFACARDRVAGYACRVDFE